MNDLRNLARVHDEETHGMASTTGARTLLDEITATAPEPRRAWNPRRLIIGSSLATAATAAAVVGFTVFPADNGPLAPDRAEAVTITKRDKYYEVLIKDWYADKKKFDEAFRKRGWNLRIRLVPVSPSVVGSVAWSTEGSDENLLENGIKEISGPCVNGKGNECMVGFKVPLDFDKTVTAEVGRPARPGETYEGGSSATEKSEVLAGVQIKGRTVREVDAELRKRDQKVAVYLPPNAERLKKDRARGDGWKDSWRVEDVFGVTPESVEVHVYKKGVPYVPVEEETASPLDD